MECLLRTRVDVRASRAAYRCSHRTRVTGMAQLARGSRGTKSRAAGPILDPKVALER